MDAYVQCDTNMAVAVKMSECLLSVLYIPCHRPGKVVCEPAAVLILRCPELGCIVLTINFIGKK